MSYKCTICLGALGKSPTGSSEDSRSESENPVSISAGPCGHVYHSLCILQWLESEMGNGCPCCRQHFHEVQLMDLFLDKVGEDQEEDEDEDVPEGDANTLRRLVKKLGTKSKAKDVTIDNLRKEVAGIRQSWNRERSVHLEQTGLITSLLECRSNRLRLSDSDRKELQAKVDTLEDQLEDQGRACATLTKKNKFHVNTIQSLEERNRDLMSEIQNSEDQISHLQQRLKVMDDLDQLINKRLSALRGQKNDAASPAEASSSSPVVSSSSLTNKSKRKRPMVIKSDSEEDSEVEMVLIRKGKSKRIKTSQSSNSPHRPASPVDPPLVHFHRTENESNSRRSVRSYYRLRKYSISSGSSSPPSPLPRRRRKNTRVVSEEEDD